jgi:Nucleotide-diphospho-sugar transferase
MFWSVLLTCGFHHPEPFVVLSCGYDVLFQDVDVVMFKNPLSFFASDNLAEWDMMFQGKDSAWSMLVSYCHICSPVSAYTQR